jgi:hypothetical protein
MANVIDTAKSLKTRISHEARHAPVSFLAAVATLMDLSVRLVAGHEGGSPPADLPISPGQSSAFPVPFITLEFLGFLVVIAFIADWLNERAVRIKIGLGVIVGLFTAVVAAYLTAANSFRLAYVMIDNEQRGLSSLDGGIITSIVVVLGLMIVLLLERYWKVFSWDALFALAMMRLIPFALVFFLALGFFVPQFETRLEPLNAAKINQRNFGH